MNISDDIKPKNIPKKNQQEPIRKINDPDEVTIRFEKNIGKDYTDHKDPKLEEREDDFFNSEQTEKEEVEQTLKNEPARDTKREYGNPMTKWVVLLILILIGLLIWQNYAKIVKVLGLDDSLKTSQDTALPSYDSTAGGTDYTGQTDANNAASTDSSQNNTATPVTTAPEVDKSKIVIEILNGNGISGSAGSVKEQLVQAGFTVDRVANAYKFSYQNTMIYFKTGKNSEADLVKASLASRQCEISNDDSVASNYDVVVVVGKN